MLKVITHRPLWVNILVGILLAIGIFSVFVMSLNWLTHHNVSRTIPSVTGKSLEDAESILEKAGFEIVIQDSIFTDTAKANVVVKQFPEPDEVVKVNRKVFLTVNRVVPPMVEMPNLVGYSIRNAEMTLRNAGLKLGDTTFRPNFAKNAVLEQLYRGEIINPGTRIRMGSKIDFVLASGVGNTEFAVPNIIGMTYAEAKARLEANGISFQVVLPNPDVIDTGSAFIYKQNPERYTEDKKLRHIRPGQTMDVWLQVDKPVQDSTESPLPLPEE
ncbi:MAG TPA: PASTA domain-containing protein [Chitinophagaceae bacterium]